MDFKRMLDDLRQEKQAIEQAMLFIERLARRRKRGRRRREPGPPHRGGMPPQSANVTLYHLIDPATGQQVNVANEREAIEYAKNHGMAHFRMVRMSQFIESKGSRAPEPPDLEGTPPIRPGGGGTGGAPSSAGAAVNYDPYEVQETSLKPRTWVVKNHGRR